MSADTTSPDKNEEVWNTVKFAFEIEEVSASVFWKETAKVKYHKCYVNNVILHVLHGKFLQFDWLRAVVFQLNLKYLRVKNLCG